MPRSGWLLAEGHGVRGPGSRDAERQGLADVDDGVSTDEPHHREAVAVDADLDLVARGGVRLPGLRATPPPVVEEHPGLVVSHPVVVPLGVRVGGAGRPDVDRALHHHAVQEAVVR